MIFLRNLRTIYEILNNNLIYKMYQVCVMYIYISYLIYIEKIDINNI
jgi:hypothetical protein